ncbi:hypothetical protein ACLOJK_017149 [Asimina triloba]
MAAMPSDLGDVELTRQYHIALYVVEESAHVTFFLGMQEEGGVDKEWGTSTMWGVELKKSPAAALTQKG